MNNGNYISDELVNTESTDFCIGIAGYPEQLYESMSRKTDLKYLKENAKTHYKVIQIFFDNEKLFDFLAKYREIDIKIKIIPELKPFTKERHISFIPKTFNIDFTEALASEFEKCEVDYATSSFWVKWCTQQSKELKATGTLSLHYYTMRVSNIVKDIISAIY